MIRIFPIKKNKDTALIDAVVEADRSAVKKLLESGADPKYKISRESYKGMSDYEWQPYTALRMVVFRLSDQFLSDEDIDKYARIAKLLIEYGADVASALELSELRYGDIKEAEDSFYRVIKVLKDAL